MFSDWEDPPRLLKSLSNASSLRKLQPAVVFPETPGTEESIGTGGERVPHPSVWVERVGGVIEKLERSVVLQPGLSPALRSLICELMSSGLRVFLQQ